MKIKIILIFLAIAVYLGDSHAQYLINQGADIVISSGSSLVIDGDFRNELDGSMDNDGEVLITGDWTNNATSGNLLLSTSGTVHFIGSSVQTIDGTLATYFNNLNLLNNATLGSVDISVSSDIIFNSTYLSLGNRSLVMQFGSSILGANSSGYVIASGSGRLLQYVNTTAKVYPIGTATTFAPITLSNTGTADYYSARLFPDVLTSGTSGVTIPQINDCVNMTWDIIENTIGGSNLTITAFWGTAMEGSSFDRAHCAVGHYTAGSWDGNPEGPASGAGPYSITRSGITTLSAFAVGDLESPMAIEEDLRIDLTVLLEGPYNSLTNLMNLDLNIGGSIPIMQPYNPTLPYYGNISPIWLYTGSEIAPSIPAGVVDWVIVQLRDATSPANASSATILDTQAAFILNDGSIVGLDGVSQLALSFPLVNDLYIVVYHRNHLGIISNYPLVPAGGIYSYDFTTGESQVYGGTNGHKELEAGKWGMIAGDGDGNGLIQLSDSQGAWLIDLGLSGYLGGDFDMNSLGQISDKQDVWLPNLGTGGQIPAKGEFTGYQSQVPK